MEFALKTVRFLGRDCNIICQNENGPCPLLAIANVLLLQNRISISTDRSFIELTELVQIIANKILEEIDASNNAEHGKLLESVFNILPKLANGLDLNVIFSSVNKFEFTEEISIFDALAIPLLHGWLCDPNDERTSAVLKDMSYNHVIFKIVDYKTLLEKSESKARDNSEVPKKEDVVAATTTAAVTHEEDPLHPTADLLDLNFAEGTDAADCGSKVLDTSNSGDNNNSSSSSSGSCSGIDTNAGSSEGVTAQLSSAETELLEKGPIMEAFLTQTAPQLTQAGILGLYNFVRDRQLAVLFRNNHFSTIFSLDGQLFLLVTDMGYLHEPAVVWELLALDGVAGNCDFYSGSFRPLSSLPPTAGLSYIQHQDFSQTISDKNAVAALSGGGGGTIATPPATTKPTATATAARPVKATTEYASVTATTSAAVVVAVASAAGPAVAGPAVASAGDTASEPNLLGFEEPESENPLLRGTQAMQLTSAPTSTEAAVTQASAAPPTTATRPSHTNAATVAAATSNTSTMSSTGITPLAATSAAASTAAMDSSVDTDRMLALHLQQQEDRAAETAHGQGGSSSYNTLPPLPPATAAAAAGGGGMGTMATGPSSGLTAAEMAQLGLSQEELDRQQAMMLQYAEYDISAAAAAAGGGGRGRHSGSGSGNGRAGRRQQAARAETAHVRSTPQQRSDCCLSNDGTTTTAAQQTTAGSSNSGNCVLC